MQDYGGPVGFRMAPAHPDRVQSMMVKNAVAHEAGWASPGRLGAPSGRTGSPTRKRYDPDLWTDEFAFLSRVIAGLAYGITGVALTARVSGAIAGSAGLSLELDAIAAAIIGGTSLNAGRGRVFGALVGALLMGSLNNGMSLLNVPTFYQDTARGIVLLLAVAIDQLSRRRSATIP